MNNEEIAIEVYNEWNNNCCDDDYYKNCMNSILNKLNFKSGVIPDEAIIIWNIIENKLL